MITNGIVITDNDLPVFTKIIEKGIKEIDFLSDFYNPAFAEDINKLRSISKKFNEVSNDPKVNQVVIEFSLYSIYIYKKLIYRYLTANIGQMDKKEIQSITSMLERLDSWVNEYLKADEAYLNEHIVFNS